MAAAPAYFELSWSILSSIGLMNVVFSLLVIGITSFSPITVVPVVVSAACAVANGLCYYAFYASYPLTQTVVAAAFADIMWLVQEAGLPFYSYLILVRVLRHRSRIIFLCAFWILMVIIAGIRTVILITRSMELLNDSPSYLQDRVDKLHIGYFTSIALVEVVSSFFLLRVFSVAKKSSMIVIRQNGLFRQLMRSTEIRVATLCLVGVTRAITYSFQSSAQAATSTASQFDRFAYTLECLFPLVMLIDIMASKLAVAQGAEEGSFRTRPGTLRGADINPNETERSRLKRDSFILLEPRATQTAKSTTAANRGSTGS